MNRVTLMGRLTRDPEVEAYQSKGESKAFVKFAVAVNRKGSETADFINCVAFGPTGKFVKEYFTKGKKILLEGELNINSVTNKDGKVVHYTSVNVTSVEFVESKKEEKETKKTDDKEVADPEDLPF